MLTAVAAACLLAAAAGQDPGLGGLLRGLADPDDGLQRELAARLLAAWPEDPAPALRAFAEGGGWRARAAMFRVLGARRALARGELARGLRDPDWPVRRAAAAACGLQFETKGLAGALAALLADPVASVARAALAALARRGELGEKLLLTALADPRLEDAALGCWLAAPERYGPRALEALLARPELRLPLLRALPGRLPPELAAPLARAAAAWRDPGLKCYALLALPDDLWPEDPVPLVLAAVAQRGWRREAGLRLGPLLPPARQAEFLADLFALPPARLRDRLQLARHPSAEALRRIAADLSACPPQLLDEVLLWLHQRGAPRLIERAAGVLAAGGPEAWVVPWLAVFGRALIARGKSDLVLAQLARGGAPAETAFALLVAARRYAPAVGEFALEGPPAVRRRRLGRLLGLGARVPAAFWSALLTDPDERVRWTAAKGLHAHAARAKTVRQRLRARLFAEASPLVRGALLSSLLAGLEERDWPALLDWVVAQKDPALDRILLRRLEGAPEPWAPALLRALLGTRLAPEARALLAARGDRAAARAFLENPARTSERLLRKARAGIAQNLEAADLPELAALFADSALPPFVALEALAWLERRPDLPAERLLSHVLESTTNDEVYERAAAILIARGRNELFPRFLNRYLADPSGDAEGLLLELVAALPAVPRTRAEIDFLLACLVAPAARAPRAFLAASLKSVAGGLSRLAPFHPLVRPVVARLESADPMLVAAALQAAWREPRFGRAWHAMTKEALARILLEAARAPGAERALAPLADWAARLGPKPSVEDGVLALLRARRLARAGDWRAAAAEAEAGLFELYVGGFPAARFTALARVLLPDSEALGRRALEVLRLWCEAEAARIEGRAGERNRALAALAIAARGGPDVEDLVGGGR